MPRVSADYVARRRRHVLDAALRCFARSGLQATSMDDVIAETGLSASTVYRWFSGKDEIIAAVSDEALGHIGEHLDHLLTAERPPGLDDVVQALVTALHGSDGHPTLARVGIMVWAESLRNPEVAEMLRSRYRDVTERLAELIRRHQAGGRLPAELDPEAGAAVVFALVPGFIVHQQLVDDTGPEPFGRALSALLGSMVSDPPAAQGRHPDSRTPDPGRDRQRPASPVRPH